MILRLKEYLVSHIKINMTGLGRTHAQYKQKKMLLHTARSCSVEQISMRHCGYHRRKMIGQGLLSIKIVLGSGIPESSQQLE